MNKFLKSILETERDLQKQLIRPRDCTLVMRLDDIGHLLEIGWKPQRKVSGFTVKFVDTLPEQIAYIVIRK